MTLHTIPINHMIASINGRRLTFSTSVINRIPIYTIITISIIVKTLGAVSNGTGVAGLNASEGLVVDVVAGLTFETAVGLDAG